MGLPEDRYLCCTNQWRRFYLNPHFHHSNSDKSAKDTPNICFSQVHFQVCFESKHQILWSKCNYVNKHCDTVDLCKHKRRALPSFMKSRAWPLPWWPSKSIIITLAAPFPYKPSNKPSIIGQHTKQELTALKLIWSARWIRNEDKKLEHILQVKQRRRNFSVPCDSQTRVCKLDS